MCRNKSWKLSVNAILGAICTESDFGSYVQIFAKNRPWKLKHCLQLRQFKNCKFCANMSQCPCPWPCPCSRPCMCPCSRSCLCVNFFAMLISVDNFEGRDLIPNFRKIFGRSVPSRTRDAVNIHYKHEPVESIWVLNTVSRKKSMRTWKLIANFPISCTWPVVHIWYLKE